MLRLAGTVQLVGGVLALCMTFREGFPLNFGNTQAMWWSVLWPLVAVGYGVRRLVTPAPFSAITLFPMGFFWTWGLGVYLKHGEAMWAEDPTLTVLGVYFLASALLTARAETALCCATNGRSPEPAIFPGSVTLPR